MFWEMLATHPVTVFVSVRETVPELPLQVIETEVLVELPFIEPPVAAH